MKTHFHFTTLLVLICSGCKKNDDPHFLANESNNWYVFENRSDTTRGMVLTNEFLYVAYQNNGLARVNLSTCQQEFFATNNSGLTEVFTTCVDEDIHGNIWVGTSNGLVRFDGTDWFTFDSSNSPLPNATIQDIECDDYGIIWIATFHGLFRKDGDDWFKYDLTNGLPDTLLRKVKSIDGRIYVGGTIGGISIMDNGAWSHLNTSNSALLGNQIRFFEASPNGSVWTGSFWHFYEIGETGWIVYDVNTGISDARVNDMAITANMKMHFATHVGYSTFQNGEWTTFREEYSQLPHNIVEMVEVDKKGNVWLGTFSGLAIYNENGIRF